MNRLRKTLKVHHGEGLKVRGAISPGVHGSPGLLGGRLSSSNPHLVETKRGTLPSKVSHNLIISKAVYYFSHFR